MALVVVGKTLKICSAMCQSGPDTVVEAGVVACYMKNFKKQTIIGLRRWLHIPERSHFVET